MAGRVTRDLYIIQGIQWELCKYIDWWICFLFSMLVMNDIWYVYRIYKFVFVTTIKHIVFDNLQLLIYILKLFAFFIFL